MLHSLRAHATLLVRLRTPGLYIINLIMYLFITMYMENQKGYLDQKMLTKKLVLSNEKKKVFKKTPKQTSVLYTHTLKGASNNPNDSR